MTQLDVGKHCGVSRSTVAAVLRNGHEAKMLHPETRNKVYKAIKELGYRPNMAGVALRGGKNNTVALAIPDMHAIEGTISSKILSGIGNEAAQLGYNLILSIYNETGIELKTSLSHILRESRVDGVFLYGMDNDDPRESILDQLDCPFVVLEGYTKSAYSLIFDNIGGAQMAVEHLLSNGRRKIAMIGYSENGIYKDRHLGYCRAHDIAGVKMDKHLCIPSESNLIHLGQHAIQLLLEQNQRFDALFCISELTAMGCIQALSKTTLKVPQDIAIVAYDDTKLSEMATPPLTSVREDGELLGRRAMQKLHSYLKGEKIEKKTEIIPVSLTIRESCGSR